MSWSPWTSTSRYRWWSYPCSTRYPSTCCSSTLMISTRHLIAPHRSGSPTRSLTTITPPSTTSAGSPIQSYIWRRIGSYIHNHESYLHVLLIIIFLDVVFLAWQSRHQCLRYGSLLTHMLQEFIDFLSSNTPTTIIGMHLDLFDLEALFNHYDGTSGTKSYWLVIHYTIFRLIL